MFSPFHRAIWDLFSTALWDRASLLGLWSDVVASYQRLIWPYASQMNAWSSAYIEPVFLFFFPERKIFPLEEDPDVDSYPFNRDICPNHESRFTSAGAFLTGLLTYSSKFCM